MESQTGKIPIEHCATNVGKEGQRIFHMGVKLFLSELAWLPLSSPIDSTCNTGSVNGSLCNWTPMWTNAVVNCSATNSTSTCCKTRAGKASCTTTLKPEL